MSADPQYVRATHARPAPAPSKTLNETMKEFDSVPLFMRDLPKEEGNTALEALQSLAFEGHPDGRLFRLMSRGSGEL